jgi:hypothetical protein
MPPIKASRSTSVSDFEASRKSSDGRGRAGTPQNYQPDEHLGRNRGAI